MKKKMKIDSFSGEYEFLSNFFPSVICDPDGITYPTVEHYFQAMKTVHLSERKEIAAAPTPGKAKRMGRRVFLRSDWEGIKIEVMRQGLKQKFADKELRDKLLATGDAILIEGNWWHDTFWGVCDGKGENNLGKLLMEVRTEMIKEDEKNV